MNFHVITLFPEVVDTYAGASILGRAQKERKLNVTSYQLRDFVTNKWGKADERPYGGGPGMVLQAEPFIRAFESIQANITASQKLQEKNNNQNKKKQIAGPVCKPNESGKICGNVANVGIQSFIIW